MKKIGEFSQYPFIRPSVTNSKQVNRSLFNKSHVRSQPDSIDYNMTFPALANEDDIMLAQDLFSRSSDYDEFLVWATTGEVPDKTKEIKGFRFKDIIKSLTVNEFNYEYKDGRFSSGVQFEMNLVEVS